MERRVHAPDLIRMRQSGQKIVMVTAYDFTVAALADRAGVDVLLVGDSLATVVQGEETTLGVTLDQIIYHTSLVSRAARRALVVADLPFMSYQSGPHDGMIAAGRAMKEGRANAVKLEGGVEMAETVGKIVSIGIPVIGHIGLTPQSYHRMGGYRIQGRTKDAEAELCRAAASLEQAGVSAIVIEGVPAAVGSAVTDCVSVPTIGIGAGAGCSGQVLVSYDLLGITPLDRDPPRFVHAYAHLGDDIKSAISRFSADVRGGVFPAKENCY